MSHMPTSPLWEARPCVYRRLSFYIMCSVAEQFICRQLAAFGWWLYSLFVGTMRCHCCSLYLCGSSVLRGYCLTYMEGACNPLHDTNAALWYKVPRDNGEPLKEAFLEYIEGGNWGGDLRGSESTSLAYLFSNLILFLFLSRARIINLDDLLYFTTDHICT